MDTIFLNSGNSKTSDPHILLLNFSDKIGLKRSDKYQIVAYVMPFKISGPTWNENLNYQMDHILYQIFKTILRLSSKNMQHLLIILQ